MAPSVSPKPESPAPSGSRHNLTPSEIQRQQLDRLLKDPTKEVKIPSALKEKTLRAPREMMKNVQGSSAGAGSGEFHVYKQNRRREYERLKLMDEKAQKEEEQRAFEERQRAAEAVSESKTSKNRLKREKKKARAKGLPPPQAAGSSSAGGEGANGKKRKLEGGGGGGGKGMVFKQRKGDDDEDDSDEKEDNQEEQAHVENTEVESGARAAGEDEGPSAEMASGPAEVVYDQPTIVIHEDN